MIKFFRNIRKSLLMENPPSTASNKKQRSVSRIGKYMTYALGEIALVFIGILLALQFNNWNEEKKKQQEVDKILIDIETDLINNYKLAELSIDFYAVQDSLAKLILYDKLTTKDYFENHRLSYYTLNWETYSPTSKNIDEFLEEEKIVSPKFKPIIHSLKRVQERHEALKETWTNLEEYIDKITYYFEDYPWMVKYDSISTMQRTQFMLNNQGYKNKVMIYWAMSQNFYDKITRYRMESMAALATLKRVKNDFTNEQIKTLFNDFEMSPFVEYKCDVQEKELKSLKALRSSELLGNLSNKTVNLKITNHVGQSVTNYELKPFEIRALMSSYFGIDGDNNLLVERQDENSNCISKFGAFQNGYLLIE